MDIVKVGVYGLVGIGLATALLSPGRQTTDALGTLLGGTQKLFHTAETGQL
jgi:hypothetical protein